MTKLVMPALADSNGALQSPPSTLELLLQLLLGDQENGLEEEIGEEPQTSGLEGLSDLASLLSGLSPALQRPAPSRSQKLRLLIEDQRRRSRGAMSRRPTGLLMGGGSPGSGPGTGPGGGPGNGGGPF